MTHLFLEQVTDLHFCRGGDCRRDHWRENKEVWRDAMTRKAKPKTTYSGMPLPVLAHPAPPLNFAA